MRVNIQLMHGFKCLPKQVAIMINECLKDGTKDKGENNFEKLFNCKTFFSSQFVPKLKGTDVKSRFSF